MCIPYVETDVEAISSWPKVQVRPETCLDVEYGPRSTVREFVKCPTANIRTGIALDRSSCQEVPIDPMIQRRDKSCPTLVAQWHTGEDPINVGDTGTDSRHSARFWRRGLEERTESSRNAVGMMDNSLDEIERVRVVRVMVIDFSKFHDDILRTERQRWVIILGNGTGRRSLKCPPSSCHHSVI